ncbi:MAG: ATP-binding cassette domain-containing protein [Hyphomicrobiales bacterium]|nr:ATP-binding cassette domain-containing protein [Hyphomicrobiales bacterium]MBV8824632.1 ATP-binding cassette domain-containing protein [Hyphomicrobiales bacterium]
MTALLSVNNLTRRFGRRAAVDAVSFEIAPGEILGVVGPGGSGKSILFDCILGRLAPSAGEVRLDGRPVTGMRARDMSRLGVARTFQRAQLFPQLTVRDNLIAAGQERRGSLWSRLVGPPDAGLADTAAEMIAFFRLDGLAVQTAGNLSEGQQKLLDIAMAFMARPRLVVLDEPATDLDETVREPLRERLRAINAQAGTTFVIIERNLDFMASLVTHLLVLAEGRVVALGDVQSVLASGMLASDDG